MDRENYITTLENENSMLIYKLRIQTSKNKRHKKLLIYMIKRVIRNLKSLKHSIKMDKDPVTMLAVINLQEKIRDILEEVVVVMVMVIIAAYQAVIELEITLKILTRVKLSKTKRTYHRGHRVHGGKPIKLL